MKTLFSLTQTALAICSVGSIIICLVCSVLFTDGKMPFSYVSMWAFYSLLSYGVLEFSKQYGQTRERGE